MDVRSQVPAPRRWPWQAVEWGVREGSLSQGHTGAIVLQLARQDATVDLVKLHQLDQVCKASLPVIHGVVEAPFLLTLKPRKGIAWRWEQKTTGDG